MDRNPTERFPAERTPTIAYLWIAWVAGFAGIVCLFISAVTHLLETTWIAMPDTWVQLAIAAFLFAIWGILFEIRERGIRTK